MNLRKQIRQIAITFALVAAMTLTIGQLFIWRAGAEPGRERPISAIAGHVCAELDASPTVATLNAIVTALFAAGNTEEQEAEIMRMAMQEVCPEYKPLAMEAVRQAVINQVPMQYT
jgi:hypothetical protein